MDAIRWGQIKEIYDRALDLSGDERGGFLAEACGGDDDLRREVESLFAAHDDAGTFLQSPAVEVAAREIVVDEDASPAPQLIGRELANYRIVSLLGRGGMGEVYLAEDKRLHRKVALKMLLARFTNDAELVRRFEREAKAASATNHPNILTIYEIGQAEGLRFIATEFVDGVTLRQAMQNDGMTIAESLAIAIQVAGALSAAHQAGIIHRDIKPENVMAPRNGIVKVLDFGLAKLTEPNLSVMDSEAETLRRNTTDSGVVMGTPRYMSPEQVRGEKVDTRTDIFSLGVVLYEMLAGRAPFTGATAGDCLASILKDDPPELTEMNGKVTPQLGRLVRRCLEKKPERRFHSAHDLGYALEALSASSGARLEVAGGSLSRLFGHVRLAWIVAAISTFVTLGVIWAHFTRQPVSDVRVFKTSILPPEKSSFDQIAVSPDGRHLAFTAATGGNVQLWVRALDSTDARPLAGTQGAIFPFWSPDSRFIGFFADGRLKKIEVTGGPALTLCEAPRTVTGAAWSRDGVILFGQVVVGLLRISATGGEVTQMTSIDWPRQETTHRYPTFLPDSRHFLYVINSGLKETRGVYLGSLDGTVKRRLLDEGTAIKYMAAIPGDWAGGDGWLVFAHDGALLARPFDTSRLEFTGEPFSLSDKVGSDLVNINYSTFSVSDNGVLVFDPSLKRQHHLYRWMDRRGQTIISLDAPAGIRQHWLSPDEKRFIADRTAPQSSSDLWLCDVSGSNSTRFTIDPASDHSPVWSPDGNSIVWASSRNAGILNLYRKAASLAGEDTLLWKSDHHNYPTDWSRDGRFIIYRQDDPKTKSDLWVLPAPGSGEAKPVVQTEANEITGTLSPDGRWLAYASDGTGRYEVYVQSFPEGGGKRQVSTGGGSSPRWRRDGRELFFYAGDGKLMASPVRSGQSFDVGAAVSLFEFRSGTVQVSFAPYVVTADGQRFLVNTVVETEPNAPLTVVVNWAAGAPK
jgi:eukaryotic-like serine/threonine-protein kinase